MYILTQRKYNPKSFNPDSWKSQPAEYMWNQGVEDIFKDKCPEYMKRVHDILQMTVGGAHETASHGETDINNAIKDLKIIMGKLKLGDG